MNDKKVSGAVYHSFFNELLLLDAPNTHGFTMRQSECSFFYYRFKIGKIDSCRRKKNGFI